jgi:hypothetical protein
LNKWRQSRITIITSSIFVLTLISLPLFTFSHILYKMFIRYEQTRVRCTSLTMILCSYFIANGSD